MAKFGTDVTTVWATQHTGGKEPEFQKFVSSKQTIVAMGYDGDVCVGANCFGSPELNKPDKLGGKQTLVVPIIALADIVTSRAVLVSGSPIDKVKKWGVLCGT